jgi:hypothetical protein
MHKETLDFIAEHITGHRQRSHGAIAKLAAGKDDELSIKEKQRFKRLLAFELLFHNLALLLMVPEMFEEIENDIEELKLCFGKLGLTREESSGKRSKKDKRSAA